MCVLFLALDEHPRHRVVLAANRDEFYERPTALAQRWTDCERVIGGRDLKAGGTWFGVTEDGGRWAALTNIRNPEEHRDDATSRGELPTSYLCGRTSAADYAARVNDGKGEYNGFNLLVGDANGVWYVSTLRDEVKTLGPGVYGLSNATLNDDAWPKVKRGLKLFRRRLNEVRIDSRDLFTMLADTERPSDDKLPDTGVGKEWERVLAPLFITSETYGTRASLALLLNREGTSGPAGRFLERSFGPKGAPLETRAFDLIEEG